MKSIICLLAAAILILPAWGYAAEKKDIPVMTAEEGTAAPARQERGEESLDEEMDDLSDESLAEKNANGERIRRARKTQRRWMFAWHPRLLRKSGMDTARVNLFLPMVLCTKPSMQS